MSQLPETIYAAFSGNIDVASSHKIVNGLAACMAGGVKAVHLFFHSSGGAVGDGIALYNFFRAMPIDLTIYNPGIVASVAAIAYLERSSTKDISVCELYGSSDTFPAATARSGRSPRSPRPYRCS